jgi:hypothetical protein
VLPTSCLTHGSMIGLTMFEAIGFAVGIVIMLVKL